jgi:hypothetical protein
MVLHPFIIKIDVTRSQLTFWIIKIRRDFCFIIVYNSFFNMDNVWILFTTNKKPMLQQMNKDKMV